MTDVRLANGLTPQGEGAGAAAPGGGPGSGTALCLSGGGYRAMLFHVGALWRLNEAGLLAGVDLVSSVSGGSITAGVLGLRWGALEAAGWTTRAFIREVAEPIRELARHTIDIWAVLSGLLWPGTIGDRIQAAYRYHLFGDATLQVLPDRPKFVFDATNLQSGALWRFSKASMADYRVGFVRNPGVPLATAVAASSAFPPFLSPVHLRLEAAAYAPRKPYEDLHREPFLTDVVLTDGGVYDNMGLEPAVKDYWTILVSDGGARMGPQEKPWHLWPMHVLRVLNLIDNQVRSLRRRHLIAAYQDGSRAGAYWGIMTDIADYGLPDALPCPLHRTTELGQIPTRLAWVDTVSQERLINWGYAVCDAALRTHVNPALPRPGGFVYPEAGV
jgi:NTE family protein